MPDSSIEFCKKLESSLGELQPPLSDHRLLLLANEVSWLKYIYFHPVGVVQKTTCSNNIYYLAQTVGAAPP